MAVGDIHLAQVVFQNGLTGLPEDRFVNTFHFREDTVLFSTGLISAAITSLYNDTVPSPGSGNLGSRLSAAISRALPVTIRYYNLSDAPPRTPEDEDTFTLVAAGSSASLPWEVALVGSFKAVNQPGVAQARTRNRVYFGPFTQAQIGSDSSGGPISDLRNTIASALNELRADSVSSADWTWVTWSATQGSAFPVATVWCDGAWDTQRRRGLAPSTRTTLP